MLYVYKNQTMNMDIQIMSVMMSIGCRTNGLSNQWVVGPMGCWSNGLSNQWAVGPQGSYHLLINHSIKCYGFYG